MNLLQHYFKMEYNHGKIVKTGKYYNILSDSHCAYVIIETETAFVSYFFDNHGKIKNRDAKMKGV